MSRKQTSAKRLGFQLIAVILVGLATIATYFIISEYKLTIKQAEDDVMQRLETIAKTISLNLDGNQHQYLIKEYSKKDEIKESDDHPIYNYMHQYLREVQLANDIETDIYTLFIDSVNGYSDETPIYFGITSGLNPYFRHAYMNFPPELIRNYKTGGPIPFFTDDNGTWLSYFAPIKNSNNEVVAVVQVDKQFDDFIMASRKEALRGVAVSLSIFLAIGAVMLLIVRSIIRIDEIKSQRLESMHEQVKSQHKDITDSINYSERIQRAIVPDSLKIKKEFPDSMLFYQAKDIISGDFPWMYCQESGWTYIAAVDCTGHGVPGCMLSFIGYFLLNDIVGNNKGIKPAEVLGRLNQGVVKTLKQKVEKSPRDGMDIALCSIDKSRKKLIFAGAHRPLYLLRKGEVVIYKGDRLAIGGLPHGESEKTFTDCEIDLEEGDRIFMFSDGLQDQFGGTDGKAKKYSTKRIRELLEQNHELSMEKLAIVIEKDFKTWMDKQVQIDDVLLIGINF